MTVKVSALNKTYLQGNKRVHAVRDLFLSVEKGEFCSIVGASGCGKSTLLQLLVGNLAPDNGRIVIDDVEMTSASEEKRAEMRRQKIGFVYQRFNLVGGLTAKENIVLPSLLDGRQPDAAWFSELADKLGIRERLDHLPSQMSGGQMQRTAIARALINRPSILIADEPTGNLDKETAAEIFDLFMTLHREGQTLIMVTHDPSLAERADRMYRMDDGKLYCA